MGQMVYTLDRLLVHCTETKRIKKKNTCTYKLTLNLERNSIVKFGMQEEAGEPCVEVTQIPHRKHGAEIPTHNLLAPRQQC